MIPRPRAVLPSSTTPRRSRPVNGRPGPREGVLGRAVGGVNGPCGAFMRGFLTGGVKGCVDVVVGGGGGADVVVVGGGADVVVGGGADVVVGGGADVVVGGGADVVVGGDAAVVVGGD